MHILLVKPMLGSASGATFRFLDGWYDGFGVCLDGFLSGFGWKISAFFGGVLVWIESF